MSAAAQRSLLSQLVQAHLCYRGDFDWRSLRSAAGTERLTDQPVRVSPSFLAILSNSLAV